VRQVIEAAARLLLPEQRDPAEDLRLRLLHLQLAKELDGGVVAVGSCDLAAIAGSGERCDLLVMGARGAGKTAAAAWFAQTAARAKGCDVLAVGWPDAAAQALGFRAVATLPSRPRDCVLLMDEAGLRVKSGKRSDVLFETLVLARHLGTSCVWTSQGLGSVHRDVLRLELGLLCKRIDPFASRFDRDETQDVLARAVAIQSRFPELQHPSGGVLFAAGAAYACSNPLAEGWSEDVSRLWG
jgi:hypothetical protein